jgi:glycosyltransferase involved in cell wall biosynthesis
MNGTEDMQVLREAARIDPTTGERTRSMDAEALREDPSLRVLALIHSLRVSGPIRGLFQLAAHAEAVGVQIQLGMFLARGLQTCDAIDAARDRKFSVEVLHELGRFDPMVLHSAWHLARRKRVRVLQSHGYKAGVVCWYLRHTLGLPWIAFGHGFTWEGGRMKFNYWVEGAVLRKADIVVAVSAATAAELCQIGVRPERIRVILNAVEIPSLLKEPHSHRGCVRWGFADDALVVGVIARYSAEKGHRVFIRAFQRVVAAVPDACAVLIGEGPQAALLQREINEAGLTHRVRLAGYEADIWKVYPLLDLFVLPSHHEGLPNALLEAMAFGRPVVVTAVSGVPEVMQQQFPEALVPPNDVSALATAIIRLLRDRPLRQRLGVAGAAYVREHFDPLIRARRIAGLYQELAGRSPSQDREPTT